ncbi:hypothetical protein D3C86_1804550 [compost metagenome]
MLAAAGAGACRAGAGAGVAGSCFAALARGGRIAAPGSGAAMAGAAAAKARPSAKNRRPDLRLIPEAWAVPRSTLVCMVCIKRGVRKRRHLFIDRVGPDWP